MTFSNAILFSSMMTFPQCYLQTFNDIIFLNSFSLLALQSAHSVLHFCISHTHSTHDYEFISIALVIRLGSFTKKQQKLISFEKNMVYKAPMEVSLLFYPL